MAISKKIAGFNDNQADSITRKVTAKKKESMFPMMIRCHIYGKKNYEGPEGWENNDHAPWYDPDAHYGDEIPGAISNGYTEQEVRDYFDKIIGFARYAFNKSHACSYSYISMLCAYLKYYYPTQFMAAVLTMAEESKRIELINVCRRMGIALKVPDINLSKRDFTPVDNSILYGLSSVKGVGDSAIPEIINNAPYSSIEDCIERIPKKAFNKKVCEALAMAGAFDSLESDYIVTEDDKVLKNRISILNKIHEIREDRSSTEKDPETGKKAILHEDETKYSEKICMEYEEKTLGSHLSVYTWWESIKINSKVKIEVKIKSVREHKDKKGGLMAFISARSNGADIDLVIFASKYSSLASVFFEREGKYARISGRKSDEKSIIVDDAMPTTSPKEKLFDTTEMAA